MKRPELNELTLEEKIGQLLMISQYSLLKKKVDGKAVPRTMEEIKEIMGKCQFGSLWGQGGHAMKNVNMAEKVDDDSITAEKYKNFLEEISETVTVPLIIGTDCENGCTIVNDGIPVSGALAIGAADDEQLTFDLAQSVAREMKATGCNWRWSPIVDIVNRYNGVSMGRTYSDDPDKIIKHAVAAVKGTESAGVASTVKHFPGYDPYEIRDAHFAATGINISLEEWRATQAKTFQGVFDAGVDSVMIGHTAFPAADDTNKNGKYLPATLSEKIIKGILRDEMGFTGVAITDGIEMSGLQVFGSYEDILIMAINAGIDVLLGVKVEDAEVVRQAVIDGRIPMERIDESAERVLKLKEKIGLFDDGEKEKIDMKEQAKKTAEIDREIAERSVTLLYDRNELLPLKKDAIKNVTIICSSHSAETEKRLETMKEEFEKRGAKTNIIGDFSQSGLSVKGLANEKDLLVYATYIGPHNPMGMPSLYGKKMQTFGEAFSYGKEKSVGVSMGYPYMHIDFMGGADTFFNIYAQSPEAMRAFVKALYGEITPTTKSPVDVEPKLRYVFG